MAVRKWMIMGTILKIHALHYSDKEGATDKLRRMTFKYSFT